MSSGEDLNVDDWENVVADLVGMDVSVDLLFAHMVNVFGHLLVRDRCFLLVI